MCLSDGRWHLRKDINMENRLVRACCAEKPDHFLSGQSGYKLVRYSSDEEITRAVADLRSRSAHTTARAAALEKAMLERDQMKIMV